MFPIVEPNGIVTGRAERAYCHSGAKPLHPVVHIQILNRSGQLYLQKRSMLKDIQPGKWDTAVGGHVSYGESIMEAVFREAFEELGIQGFASDFGSDYTCMEVLQGLSISQLVSMGGRE